MSILVGSNKRAYNLKYRRSSTSERNSIIMLFFISGDTGIVLFNSEDDDTNGDFIALLLDHGHPTFILKVDRENGPILVKATEQLTQNTWHRIVLKRTNSKRKKLL